MIAAALEAAMHFNIFSLSSGKVRIDVILPALLVITGGICWARVGAKGAVTAATVLFAAGLIQLGAALRFLG